MTYPTISAKSAATILQLKQSGVEVEIDSYISFKDSEDSFGESDAKNLIKKIDQIQKDFPNSIKKGSRFASEFEAKASEVVHKNVPYGSYCADPEFWIWLANAYFEKVISWRYEGKFAPANLGIGAPTENFVFRLWLRAELVLDESRPNKYELVQKGGSVDFWRSHLFRQSYANARPFARALLQFQYPNDDDKPKLDTLGIRDLAKRLARIKSNLLMACLDEKEAFALIESEAKFVATTSIS